MRLFLIRHGDTEIGPDGLYPDGGGLTELGRRQAAATVEPMRAASIAHIVTSSIARARETAEPLAASTGLVPEVVPGFDEVKIGNLREAPIETITRRIYGASPRADFSEFGGENAQEFARRVLDALSHAIVDRYAGSDSAVAAYVHGGTISVILDHVDGIRFSADLNREIPNGSISAIVIEGRMMRLESGPNAAHLESVGITHLHGNRPPPHLGHLIPPP